MCLGPEMSARFAKCNGHDMFKRRILVTDSEVSTEWLCLWKSHGCPGRATSAFDSTALHETDAHNHPAGVAPANAAVAGPSSANDGIIR